MIIAGIVILTIVLIIWAIGAISHSKWNYLKDLDMLYLYGRTLSVDINRDKRLVGVYDTVYLSDPKSESLQSIRELILQSITKLATIYKEDKNREFTTEEYLNKYKLIRRQATEYFDLLKKQNIKSISELDLLTSNISAYKEACILLEKNK
jgi:hypothetical protein